MKRLYTLFCLIIIVLQVSYGQENSGVIKGKVVDASSNEPVPFASVVIWNTTIGAMTDFDGNFLFTGVRPGYVEIRASSVGYKPYISEAVMVTNNNEVNFLIPLQTSVVAINDVVIRASPF
ncbi:MAG: carboxypeptidase-like regulatory domain-containing protein, partial [Bacteroidales bacterium]|nr:carboxypeptidase-like regulatory domain-containing protein [Bacteroidales bacterium]